MLCPGGSKRHAVAHGSPNGVLDVSYLVGNIEHVGRSIRRDHHDAICIAANEITVTHSNPTDGHGFRERFDLHAIFARPHPPASTEDGIREFATQGCVSAQAIDDGPANAPDMGHFRQDVAPDRASLASAVVQGDNRPGCHIIDVVANGFRWDSSWPISHRECRAAELKCRRQWHDASTLASDAKSIERVANRCGVEGGGTSQICGRQYDDHRTVSGSAGCVVMVS
jgi:hypothetical protein